VGAADRRQVTGGAEAVKVVAARPQASQFDVQAVRWVRHRRASPAALDALESVVGGDFPAHVDRARRHAAEAVIG
jgi:hypothetical protein